MARKGRRPIGKVKEGGFHEWLGKSPEAPITQADLDKGLAAGGHPAQMANFARNARTWSHRRVSRAREARQKA